MSWIDIDAVSVAVPVIAEPCMAPSRIVEGSGGGLIDPAVAFTIDEDPMVSVKEVSICIVLRHHHRRGRLRSRRPSLPDRRCN